MIAPEQVETTDFDGLGGGDTGPIGLIPPVDRLDTRTGRWEG